MKAFNFKRCNLITGWIIFGISLLTYWLTVEPTASFWDPGEFITTSSNLEIGHPPGAPLFQLIGAVFSIFALDGTQVALMVNLTSVFSSAFTIAFMYWSLSILLENIMVRQQNDTTPNRIAIIGAAAIGSLSFAFTDSFWFNAGEAEVYAMSSLFIAALFYAGLRWERAMFMPHGHRWLLLICFIVGLSFGVHFMSLLTIPAIGMLYYFKHTRKVTWANFIVANVVTAAVLLFVFVFLLPQTMTFFGNAEIFFTNSLGLPFNSGTIIAALIVIAAFYFGLRYTRNKSFVHLNTMLLGVLFIFLGFSSWIMLPIRANAGTVINENNPNNARELLAYYNREQYPETKLLYGPYFTEKYVGLDPNEPFVDGKPNYERDEVNKKYIIVNNWELSKQNIDASQKGFLPRMWNSSKAVNYLMFTGGLDFILRPEYLSEPQLAEEVNKLRTAHLLGELEPDDYDLIFTNYGEYIDIQKPSFAQNMGYMFNFQFGYMYMRYFMWNFTGRQNDIQGKMTNIHGNWISGIDFIDSWRLGNQEYLPTDLKTNKARNTYFFLPLILGLIGAVYHSSRNPRSFWVLLALFLYTGIALKIYLNEGPFEPRERDYALVGSFYVFAMWIGFGAYALYHFAMKYLSPKVAIPAVSIVCLLASPVLLATQNWDDHDRSNRYTANAMAKQYLDSCGEQGIIFTIGDNDTFPLWHAQGVEGYRQDVRVVNTSLFQTDWYIDDMKKQAYTSLPIPSQLEHNQYVDGTRDYIMYQKTTIDTLDIKLLVDFIANDSDRAKVEMQNGSKINYFPAKTIRIPVNKEAVLRSGVVAQEDAHLIEPYIYMNITSNVLYKSSILMLDILANNDWERPIHFSGGSMNDEDYIWLKDYLQLDGVVYTLVPIKSKVDKNNPFDMGRIHWPTMYEIVTNWEWGNIGTDKIYHDVETRRNSITYRTNLIRLAENLYHNEELEKAEEILDLAMEKTPLDKVGYVSTIEPYIQFYYLLGAQEKARDLYYQSAKDYQEYLKFYSSMAFEDKARNAQEVFSKYGQYYSLMRLLNFFDPELAIEEYEIFNHHLDLLPEFFDEEDKYVGEAIESDSIPQDLLEDIERMQQEARQEALQIEMDTTRLP